VLGENSAAFEVLVRRLIQHEDALSLSETDARIRILCLSTYWGHSSLAMKHSKLIFGSVHFL